VKREEPDTYRLLRKATQSAAMITAKTTTNTRASCPFSTGEYFPSAVDAMTLPLTGTAATDTSHWRYGRVGEELQDRGPVREPSTRTSRTSPCRRSLSGWKAWGGDLTLQDYERLRRVTLTIRFR
jgi:hypothetical protein